MKPNERPEWSALAAHAESLKGTHLRELFASHPALARGRPVWFIEDQRFFSVFRFHQQKLVLHRASLQAYARRRRINSGAAASSVNRPAGSGTGVPSCDSRYRAW